MQSLDQQLQSIDEKMLTKFVGKALNDSNIEDVNWAYTKINIGRVPSTAGVYRFSGTALSQKQQQRWSLVLKVLQRVEMRKEKEQDYWEDNPIHFLYWKREALFFQSRILSKWKGGLVPVKCYGVTEPTTDSVWLWLEDVKEKEEIQWGLERHILAARHFGEFNGAYSGRDTTNVFHWLNRSFIKQYLTTLYSLGIGSMLRDSTIWEHPTTKKVFPIPINKRAVRLLENSNPLLNQLATNGQTLSHQDTDRRNLFARQSNTGQAETVVIDWGFLGLAAVGEDLGNQVLGNLFHLEVDISLAYQYQEAAFEAYLSGLQAFGWHGNPEAIHFAYRLQALTYIVWIPLILGPFIKEGRLPPWADAWTMIRGCSAEETLELWGKAIYFILDVVDSAS